MKKLSLILSSFIIFLILLSFEVKSDEIKLISGSARVIDGDSIEINKKK